MNKSQGHNTPTRPTHRHGPAVGTGAAASQVDPVCGMTVAENADKAIVYNDTKHYFCSEGCRARFKENPVKFATSPSAPVPASGSTLILRTLSQRLILSQSSVHVEAQALQPRVQAGAG